MGKRRRSVFILIDNSFYFIKPHFTGIISPPVDKFSGFLFLEKQKPALLEIARLFNEISTRYSKDTAFDVIAA